ncbi:radical SAM protein [Candidatus Bathycorpusculum sp.]|uniref:radical SAM/SPASM domain-containing protein n=1 Tax=Candidatus Bathycorpusculum sp. TaxID=2994959 RepID=UPI002817281A|nr:radical SAM protein [Candidatus Termitimicrobium sp.]MCL2686087.1 radical SAM protein [Candidatus Termitimicrobium sp.]
MATKNSTDLTPKVVAWESTRACNYACSHCRATAQKHPDPTQLTTHEALNMVDQIAAICTPVFIISGGDPLQRTDIFEVATYASKLGFRVVMSPSGSDMSHETFEKMKQAGICMISLSLDGATTAIHDNFRNVPGAFDLVLKNITLAKAHSVPFRINTTITQHNYQTITAIHKTAVEQGAVEWDAFMLVPTGRGKIDMEITPHQYEETLQTIYQLSLVSPIPVKVTCAPQYTRIVAQQAKEKPVRGGRGCMAGNGFCFISHTGDVFGCGFLPLCAGSIRQQSFQEIYQQSPLFVELRNHRLLKGKCGTCPYSGVCGGCRARAFSTKKDYFEEEPYCIFKF